MTPVRASCFEKFMVAMLDVKDPAEKIDALTFKASFVHRRNDIIETAKVIEVACDDVKMSLRLKKLLAIILKVGNQLNHGNEAHAFTLESLLKLNQSKAFDRKTTILHYLVTLVKRNDETLLRFKDDISSIVRAEKVAYEQTVVQELNKLRAELKRVEKIALAEAEKLKSTGGSGMSRLSLNELAGMKTSLVRTSSGNATVTHHDKALPIEDISLTPIGRFSVDAASALQDAESYASKVSKKFRDVLRYFGEDAGLAPMQFFQTLSAFTRAFENALEGENNLTPFLLPPPPP